MIKNKNNSTNVFQCTRILVYNLITTTQGKGE
jgi:hypothetical protein